MSKKAWIIIIILLVGMFGYFIVSGDKSGNNDPNYKNSSPENPKKLVADDHIQGSPAHKIVVIEYMDFECPGCRATYPIMEKAYEKYKDKVTFVRRYFPLTNIHQNALASARAGEAASKQGKYFEMEKLLFEGQDSWKGPKSSRQAQEVFEGYAKQLGLNVEQFKKDYASSETLDRINRDRSTGNQMGVTGTPTIFLNGEVFTIQSQENFNSALEDAIKQGKTDPNQK